MRRIFLMFLVLFTFSALPAFAVKPRAETGIQWTVSPPEAVVFLDGKKLGTAGNLKFTKATPGKHTIKLTKGGDEAELEVKVTKGQVLQFNYSFSE